MKGGSHSWLPPSPLQLNRALLLKQSQGARLRDCGGSALHAELGVKVRQVPFDGAHCHDQPLGDLGIVQPRLEQVEKFDLPRRQRLDQRLQEISARLFGRRPADEWPVPRDWSARAPSAANSRSGALGPRGVREKDQAGCASPPHRWPVTGNARPRPVRSSSCGSRRRAAAVRPVPSAALFPELGATPPGRAPQRSPDGRGRPAGSRW